MSLILKSQIKNKTVALVGNAQSLTESNHGAEIDSHDVVCRINRGPDLCGSDSHGNRTDILFFSMPEWVSTNKDVLENVLMIHTGHCHNPSFMNDQEKKMFKPTLHTDYFFPREEFDSLKKQMGYTRHKSWPSTGATSLHLCLRGLPKKLALYGFDFKKTYTFYHENKTGDPATLHDRKRKHDWTLERRYVEKLIKQHSHISLK